MSVILNSPNVVIGHMSGGTININNGTTSQPESKKDQAKTKQVEDITPVQEEKSAPIDSIIFTKKAKREAKIPAILDALKKSVNGRRDKTRAFVDELHSWQHDGYVDAHYNAKVMFDELEKITPLAFKYNAFRKYYNNLS